MNLTVPEEQKSDLQFIANQLDDRFGIEATPNELYWQFYNDMDRDHDLAAQAVRHVSDHGQALEEFAPAMIRRDRVHIVPVKVHDWSMIAIAAGVCLCVGMALGAWV